MGISESFVERRIDFHFTDAMGIMHYSNFYRLCDAVEAEFYRALGDECLKEFWRYIAWIRIHSECEYLLPVFHDDLIKLHLWVKAKTSRTLTFRINFYKEDLLAARAKLTVACVKFKESAAVTGSLSAPPRTWQSAVIPEHIGTKISVATYLDNF